MLNWKTLCASIDVGSLVPDQFSEYRQPISDGLLYFLENLSPARQLRIIADQTGLPVAAPVEMRLVSVARHCPILQKIGQVLARDRRLPTDFRQLLQGLESGEPTMTGREAREIVESELGDLQELGLSIDRRPIAEASMAVVIPFVWHRSGQRKRGVFKLLKPDIEKNLEEELRLLSEVGNFLDQRCNEYGIPGIDYEELFGQVRDLLNNEVDLRREQENMESARQTYAESPGVVIPELFPFCTPRVTAMERMDGQKITELDDSTAAYRRRLASRMIDALIARPMWSAESATLFHADPHAGNLMVTDDQRLVLLDWGLVGSLTKQERIEVSQILIGAITLDAGRITAAITDLADDSGDHRTLQLIVHDALRSIRWGTFPGLGWLVGLMDDAVARAGLTFSADLLLFRKSLLMLEGVIADVSEDCTPSIALAASLATRFGGEWPERMISLPFDRSPATHISNADLFRLLASGPSTTARFWRGFIQDLIQRSVA